MEITDNEPIVPEQELELQKKDTARFAELNTKSQMELKPEEKTELEEIKVRYSKSVQKRIDALTKRTKIAEEKAEQADRDREEFERKISVLESKTSISSPPAIKEDFVEIDGQRFYTDIALQSMRDMEKITDIEAFAYQQKRNKAEIKADILKEIYDKKSIESEGAIRKADAGKVLEEYPEFSNKHPNHNPDDPLYRKTNELFEEGYRLRPDGLSLALKRAKEILRISNKRIDRFEDFHVEDNNSLSAQKKQREEEVVLSDYEKQTGIRQWTAGDIINPKTGKEYTETEALEKTLTAKKRRLGRV